LNASTPIDNFVPKIMTAAGICYYIHDIWLPGMEHIAPISTSLFLSFSLLFHFTYAVCTLFMYMINLGLFIGLTSGKQTRASAICSWIPTGVLHVCVWVLCVFGRVCVWLMV